MRLRNQSKEKKGIKVKYDMMTKLKNENILKTFSIARKNRYQVLEDGGLAIKEEDKEIGRDFQIMEKTYTEVAERVLEDLERGTNHGLVTNHGTL